MDKASADALFDAGRQLMDAGDYAAACKKFEASQGLDPGVGTLLNLADCYERSGRTASAWSAYRETLSTARRTNSRGHERIARERLERLTPRLSYLTIATSDPSVLVTRDGIRIEPATFGTAIPVDPGTHEILASAPGKEPFREEITISDDATKVSVQVPALTVASQSSTASAAVAATGAKDDSPRKPESDTGLGAQRILALSAGAVGVAAIATGVFFGAQAKSALSDARDHCSPYPFCSSQGKELGHQAERNATISTALFIAGGVGLAAFATLWLTAPSGAAQEPKPVAFVVTPFAVEFVARM